MLYKVVTYHLNFRGRYTIIINYQKFEARCGAGGHVCGCICDWLWVRSAFEEMKYSIFSFCRPGVDVSLGVEFRRSTRNASGGKALGGKRGTECLNTEKS